MKYIVFDTESSGLKVEEGHRPLTAGFAVLENGEILATLEVKIWDDSFIVDPKALEVNRIDLDSHKLQAVSPAIACEQIGTFILQNFNVRPLAIAYNESFDSGMLSAIFKACGLSWGKLIGARRDALPVGFMLQDTLGLPNAQLGTICGALGITFEGAQHSALVDTVALCKLWTKVQQMIGAAI